MFDCEVRILLFELLASANLDVHERPDGRFAWGRYGEIWGVLRPSEALLKMLLEAASVSYGGLLFEAAMLSDVLDEGSLSLVS